jgi:biopolymer transport protein ExbD
MGAVDLGGSKKPAGGGQGWKRPRVTIRIDMTPMVDIAFLLLIFFMVTTVFRLPTAMEMVLPPDKKEDEPQQTTRVLEDKLITFLVMENDSLAYYVGIKAPQPLAWDSLKSKLLERYDIYGDSVVVLTRIHPKAKYATMVNLIDEFNLAKTTRFTIDKYTTEEDSLLRKAKFETSGPQGLPEPAIEYETAPSKGS